MAQDKLRWLDGEMTGRAFVCGDRFSLADILLFCFTAFGKTIGQQLPADSAWLPGWFDRIKARPSAAA